MPNAAGAGAGGTGGAQGKASGGGGGAFLFKSLGFATLSTAGLVVAYAKVPAFKTLLDDRDLRMPTAVYDLYTKLGWEVERPKASAAAAAASKPTLQITADSGPGARGKGGSATARFDVNPAPQPAADKGSVEKAAQGTGGSATAGGGAAAAPAAETGAVKVARRQSAQQPKPRAQQQQQQQQQQTPPAKPADAVAAADRAPAPKTPAATDPDATAAAADNPRPTAAQAAAAAPAPPVAVEATAVRAAAAAMTTEEAAAAAPAAAAAAAEAKPTKQQAEVRRLRLDALRQAEEEVMEAGAALRKELEATVLADIDKLDEQALRYKVVQLAAEMQNRTKWEALRLQQSLKATEEEASILQALYFTSLIASRRYLSLVRQQAEESEAKLKQELADQEEQMRAEILQEYQGKLQEHIVKQAQGYEELAAKRLRDQEAQLSETFSAQVAEQLSKVEQEAAQMAEERQAAVAELRSQVQAVRSAWDSVAALDAASAAAHRLTAAALALEARLRISAPAPAELAALRSAAGADALASAAAAAVPPSAASAGVPTAEQLRRRFARVRGEAARAALVPGGDGAGVMGQAVGALLSVFTLPRHGMVEGSSADDVLARAECLLDGGDLRSAVKELSRLEGLAAVTARDWVQDAEARLRADDAMRALRCRCSTWQYWGLRRVDEES
ncbi:mitochondrial inner membrane protein-domain-containing protein [Tribonema minus]|uniref:Mitochondrial inner membrane protein-domain-containing protein n=1 Tax=Tribonema minus TaxID=303371 RepID=A0A835YW45_9STRA|nr:mitochondrial inner membrane protein-domain-containing protein [Tribonema minus]